MEYYQLQPMLMTCDFNFEMIMSIITPLNNQNQIEVYGNFRTNGDFGGMIFTTVDNWSHPVLKYRTENNFSGVILSYDYNIGGSLAPLNALNGQSLTVNTYDGVYYVRLWNYVVDRPVEEWELGSGYLFPRGRIPNGATGISGHIVLDFDNLYAGWREYDDEYIIVGYYDDGVPILERRWFESPSWVRIDPSNIISLMWGFNTTEYDKNNKIPFNDSKPFSMIFSNWHVENAKSLGTTTSLDEHLYRLADGYDDSYAATPERYIKHFHELGFRDIINVYIGASHYYDKTGDPNKPTPDEYVPYQYTVKKQGNVLNYAFSKYSDNFCYWASSYGFNIISSISMEMTDAPLEWAQFTADGIPATSGWTPPPKFVSFTNDEVKDFYVRYVTELEEIQSRYTDNVTIQLGEPWWWNEGDKPCFYDNSTKSKFLAENGYSLPEYTNMWDENYDTNAINWLRKQNGLFLEMIKNATPNSKHTVLFFPPTVIDLKRVGKMMREVNFPKEYWENIGSREKLDFFMIEDYDWVIDNDPMHETVYGFVWKNLKYQWYRTHYFAGFVLNSQLPDSELWVRITDALIDGVNNEFHSYLWAGPQIRRDGWLPVEMKWKTYRTIPKNAYFVV